MYTGCWYLTDVTDLLRVGYVPSVGESDVGCYVPAADSAVRNAGCDCYCAV